MPLLLRPVPRGAVPSVRRRHRARAAGRVLDQRALARGLLHLLRAHVREESAQRAVRCQTRDAILQCAMCSE